MIGLLELTEKNIDSMTEKDLFDRDVLFDLYDMDPAERERLIALMMLKAKECGVQKEFASVIREWNKADKQLADEHKRAVAMKNSVLPLEVGAKGAVLSTVDNFVQILRYDPKFEGIRFNEMTNRPEKVKNGIAMLWGNADDAEARRYIEQKYHIHSAEKLNDALDLVFQENAYHPARDLIDSFSWDGNSRINSFLHKWMMCEDTPYTREVSRLIFAGGIHRLYRPGCKFDDMPVLIGTKQGEGKSTLVHWLAIQEEFFAEITQFEGNVAIEQLSGAWICEVSELLAMTRTKEQEAVKSFLTRTKDAYRKPYARRPETLPRQCVFIGTTNRAEFLTDKTGNRRFYPVRVRQNGYNLFDHETECREYIRQCWAEAKTLLNEGEIQPFADRSLIPVIRDQQNAATVEDYRVGMIESYLSKTDVNEVCLFNLFYDALGNDNFKKPSPADQRDINTIMQNMPGWERQKNTKNFRGFGSHRYWKRVELPDGFEEIHG